MIQYNILNIKLSNSQLNKLKSAIKNGTEVTLNLSSNLIGSSNDETNFPHKFLLTNTQVPSKYSGMTLTDNEIKHIIKMIKSLENRGILLKGITRKITSQEGGFFNFLRPLMKASLPFMKSLLTPLAKSILLPLGLSAVMSAADAAVRKKIFGSGTTALII